MGAGYFRAILPEVMCWDLNYLEYAPRFGIQGKFGTQDHLINVKILGVKDFGFIVTHNYMEMSSL